MIRQYKKFVNTIKKTKRKILKYLKKNIPFVRAFSEWRKKFWSFKYCTFGSIDESMIVFKSNNGIDYSGRPAQIYEQMISDEKYKNFKFVWLFQNKGSFKHLNQNTNTRIYSAGSKKGIKIASKAHYMVTNYELAAYQKLRKKQILVFDPEEYYSPLYLFKQNININSPDEERYALEKVLKYVDYITISNKDIGEKILKQCELYGNKKVRLINTSTYLMNFLDEGINKREYVDFMIPKDRHKVFISLSHRIKCSTVFMKKLEYSCLENNQFIIFNKKPKLTVQSDIDYEIVKKDNANEEDIELTFDNKLYKNIVKRPSKIQRKELYHMVDLVLTDKFNEILECIFIKKPFLWVRDDRVLYNGLDQQSIEKLAEIYPQLNHQTTEHLFHSLHLKWEAPELDIVNQFYTTDSVSESSIMDSFINFEIGSGDGPVKSLIRRHTWMFRMFRRINLFLYGVKSMKKTIAKSIKNILKIGDLKILYGYYTFTGWFRKNGINLSDNSKKLYKYKNMYRGERCFLVGNGPSLTAEDLELIQNEKTFGCNRVYKLFSSTSWRPTFFCMIDALIAKYSSEELADNVHCPMFTNINTRDLMEFQPKDLVFVRNLGEEHYRISNNFTGYYVPSGATVMTFMLELAMYMGFSEIYLIGVDCTSSLSSNGHCAKGYNNSELIQKDIERVRKRLNDDTLTAEQVAAYYFDKSTSSYRVIKEYADKHNFHIYNATRGGMLEVFERKDLDEVLRGKNDNR